MHLIDKCFRKKSFKMKTITVLLSICWTLWFSHIFAISAWLNRTPNFPASVSISVEDASKDILVGDIENVIADDKNDSSVLQNSSVPLTTSSNEDELMRQIESPIEGTKSDVNKTESDGDNSTSVEKDELNLTEENQIPVFSEWAQKRLEEVEKEVEQEAVNTSTMKKNAPAANKQPVLKLKNLKNYASPVCGAKIIAANIESSGTSYVLTSTRDEYLLSPCKSRIWFVVELCEAIQAERIDLANYELFSSSPKNFSVAVSSRFPTRDWSNVGRFVAKDERYIQSFDLFPHLFGKYVRVDVHSHYNSEHFCPISLFRVYGTSEFEAFETENRQHPIDDIDDDDEDDQESDANKSKTNIFKSASDAVMSIVDTVKKAASFVKPNGNKTTDNDSQHASNQNLSNDNCISPNHAIYCENCSDGMTREVTALIECKQNLLKRLLDISIIRNSLYKSQICNTLIGLDLNINCSEPIDINSTTSKQLIDLQMEYIIHLFSNKYIAAMCNLLAANDRKNAWNSTIPLSSDPPINITIDRKASDPILQGEHAIKAMPPALESEQTDQVIKSSSQEDNAENKSPPEHQSSSGSPADSSENMSQETQEPNENIVENSEKEVVEITTPLPTVESSEEIIDKGQNIFNVVDSAEASTESQTIMAESSSTEPTKTVGTEQETPPSVIILPETTTPTPNDLNDASEEQAANGWTNAPQFGQKLHSESVFLRLSNRVKALERNMSLSGQYLEELSRRYKKQVEELQMSFAKTLVNIEEQSRRNLERKEELFEQNQKLRNDLEILTERIFSWRNIIICGACFTCVQLLIFHLILKIWGQKYGLGRNGSNEVSAEVQSSNETLTRKRKSGNVPMKFRRKSAEEKRERTLSESSSSALQRRPSTEALNITGTYTELLIDDTASTDVDYQIAEKNPQHNKSTSSESHDLSGYVKIEDLKDLYDKPGEEEYEFYGPVQEQKYNQSGSQQIDDCGGNGGGSETTMNSSLDSVTSHPKKSKALKNKNRNRRLSSPLFFKSPFSSGSAPQSTGWEWHRSKKPQNSSQTNKKSKSESPPSLKQNGINNNNNSTPTTNSSNQNSARNDTTRSSISSSIDDRKSSGSFKRILKKMF
ncbi:SUN domain-containing ossification factor isoform X2 [Sitodiplosis mosellana]|uniref:SUN domain-containing ossification factor isoform X2 n=1 Tax=Sitodiplosis mosellana TaxID=263140 RepID=UPI00244461CB|nr:SUN domain-containing ossification factor isoform X2 [Sitodiplosis mosellana]XP_055305112.1 SUN domain-containing ossification factor isoform X2 [Sitodiplosis mosellana]